MQEHSAPKALSNWNSPQLRRFGALAAVTAAGTGTVAELGYFYTQGAPTCARPNAKATAMGKHPCG